MVLAAGLGTRLQPLTHFRAKPAVPFLGRPLIHSSLELLSNLGVQDCVINLHHLPDSVRKAVLDIRNGLRIHFSHETAILGTAGALARVRQQFRDRTVILANGKIYFEEELRPALDFHRKCGAWSTLVLAPFRIGMPFNPVWVDSSGSIRSFRSIRSERGDPLPPTAGLEPYVFTGVHILDPKVLDLIPDQPYETVRDLYPRLMESGKPVVGYISDGFWCETSTPQRYLEKSIEVLTRRGLQGLDFSETGASIDQSVVGFRTRLGEGCGIIRSVIWDQVSLARDTRVENSVVVDGVEIAASTLIRNCVVTPRLPLLEPLCRLAGGFQYPDHIRWPFASDPFVRLQSERS
jgi:NDP-sugar pyrophosphorylase family protein